MKATIYIPDDQAPIYEEAKQKLGESISKTFVRCLARELESAKLKTSRIVFELRNESTYRVSKKAFEGRFIVADAERPENFYFDEATTGIRDAGHGGYAIAVTKAKQLAVLEFDGDRYVVEFKVHKDFDDFKNATIDTYQAYPDSLIAAVAAELDVEHVEELDI